MMSKLRASRERDERGFTLIELLVVILIIAILAAIAIPVFLRQREKGWVAQTESALKNAAIALESHATDNNGSYLAMVGADGADDLMKDEGFRGTADVTITVTEATTTDFCIDAAHGSLDDGYSYSSETGKPEKVTCAGPVVP